MKVVYMGTPAFAVPSLEALIKHHEVLGVLTQPDRPAGRGNKLTQSPVKVTALAHNIPVYQPENLRLENSRELRATLKALGADIFVVAAYGIILPKGILNMAPLGCINVHGSILPKYRGASPIHGALLNGDTTTGITIIHMDSGIDTGDMIVKHSLDILPGERFPSLHDRMADLGAVALLDAMGQLAAGTAPREVQDDGLSCYAPMLKKSDGHINWHWESQRIVNMVNAFDPWPGAYAMYGDAPLKVWGLEMGESAGDEAPGTVLQVDPGKGVLVKTGDGALWITELQGGGSKRMLATDYLRGRSVDVGALLG